SGIARDCAMIFPSIPAAVAMGLIMLAAQPRAACAQTTGTLDAALHDGELSPEFRALAKASGEPQVPGIQIIYLHPLGEPAEANRWQNIIVHQSEGPAGSAKAMALLQAKNPSKRGVALWVETDGTVYWSTAETAVPNHGDGGNRNDNKYI